MSISWLTIRDLEYLVAVGKHLHFAKAAAACHVSQPALSIQIKKMEDHLKVAIFERTNRRVAISQAGQSILLQAQRILDEAQKLGELASSKHAPLESGFRLGAIGTLGPYFIPHLLGPLRKRFPKLQLFVREGLTDPLLEELKSGELDAVLAADTFTQKGLTKVPLFFESFLLALPKGHELAGKDNVSAKDLNPQEMVLLEEGHCLADQTLALCQRGKGARREGFQATGLETLRSLVASGAGYSLFPELATEAPSPMDPLLKYRDLKGEVGRKVILVHRESYGRMADIDALVKTIRDELPKTVKKI